MTTWADIRQWLLENPGWHFAGDVVEGMGAQDRLRVSQALCRMAKRGHLTKAGKRGAMRFRYLREARKLTIRPINQEVVESAHAAR